MPKFDYVIQNPPYSRSLHLNFLELALELTEKSQGNFSIINPSTWLIQLQPNGSYRKQDCLATNLRNKIDKHVSEVIIENYNNEFRTGLNMSFSVVKGNVPKQFDKIKFLCCGDESYEESIHDCNLVGKWSTVASIFEKIKRHLGQDLLKDHLYKKGMKINKNTYFAAVSKVMRGGCGDPRFSDEWFINGLYRCYYYHCFNDKENISLTPHKLLFTGYGYSNPKYKDELAYNIYGTKEELKNFREFVFENDLCKFINICIIQDMNKCNIEKYVPWISYKISSEDIYKKIELNEDEIKLVQKTLKRYNKNSKWFQRYLSGNISNR